MKNYPLILLCGKARSGKDTAAGFIKEIIPNTITIAQAAPIKDLGRLIFGFNDEQLHGNLKETIDSRHPKHLWGWVENCLNTSIELWDKLAELEIERSQIEYWVGTMKEAYQENLTPRIMMQSLGEYARNLEPDLWIDHALTKTAGILDTNKADLVVITDGRFRNEILGVKYTNGTVVSVKNTENPDVGISKHPSEMELDSVPYFWYDKIIINNKENGLEHYKEQIQQMMMSL